MHSRNEECISNGLRERQKRGAEAGSGEVGRKDGGEKGKGRNKRRKRVVERKKLRKERQGEKEVREIPTHALYCTSTINAALTW